MKKNEYIKKITDNITYLDSSDLESLSNYAKSKIYETNNKANHFKKFRLIIVHTVLVFMLLSVCIIINSPKKNSSTDDNMNSKEKDNPSEISSEKKQELVNIIRDGINKGYSLEMIIFINKLESFENDVTTLYNKIINENN